MSPVSMVAVGLAWIVAGFLLGWLFGGISRIGSAHEPEPVSVFIRRTVKMAFLLGLVALGIFVLTGCTLQHRGWLPNTPANGQTAEQIQRDKDECTAIAKRNLPPLGERLAMGLVPIPNDYGARNSARLEGDYAACMSARGYTR